VDRLNSVIAHENTMQYLSRSIDTLVDWMRNDVFEKAGIGVNERRELYDFIIEELSKLEAIHPRRIKEVRVAL
jgi:hypothetical protein